jgi:hypothetical protein
MITTTTVANEKHPVYIFFSSKTVIKTQAFAVNK